MIKRALFYVPLFFRSTNCLSTLPSKYILTPKQEKYSALLDDTSIDLIVTHGPAGSGKTVLACKSALEQLKYGNKKRLIITRPVVTVEDENIGFLPGTMNEKMHPFLIPILDFLKEELSQQKLESLLRCGTIEIAPFGFMRGRTFNDCFIVADEMQNSTPQQMRMMLTRIGMNSKIVITGDKSQSDLAGFKKNGLEDLLSNLEEHYGNEDWRMFADGISTVELKDVDIKRSRLCKKILDIYSS